MLERRVKLWIGWMRKGAPVDFGHQARCPYITYGSHRGRGRTTAQLAYVFAVVALVC